MKVKLKMMNKYLRHVDLHQIRILRKKNNPWRKIESENENIDFSKVIEDEKKLKTMKDKLKMMNQCLRHVALLQKPI